MTRPRPEREHLAKLFGLSDDALHLDEALTHPSFANERRGVRDNQRLEFLGDAVLGFCVSELVYERFPDADEGTLTRLRALLVNAESLAGWARSQPIAAALRLGRGADAGGLRDSTNVLADAVEALLAATLLDAGLDAARAACRVVVEARLAELEGGSGRDPKSELQERVQASGCPAPTYEVLESGGPAHARWFVVAVRVGDCRIGDGRGSSKRAAERAAAASALASEAWIQAPSGAADAKAANGTGRARRRRRIAGARRAKDGGS